MTEIREAPSKGQAITRLTLFPPSGRRIEQLIKDYNYDGVGRLHYTDDSGVQYETTLPFVIEHITDPFVIEHITESYGKAPFREG